MESFRPALALVPAGFDSRGDDPLGLFRLEGADFSELTEIVMEIAGRRAQSRLASLLEGGYSLDGTPRAAAAHVRVLARIGKQ